MSRVTRFRWLEKKAWSIAAPSLSKNRPGYRVWPSADLEQVGEADTVVVL